MFGEQTEKSVTYQIRILILCLICCVFFYSFLLGLEAELFYVRDGVVNNYAMMFVIPVNANIYDLEFSWQRLTSYPVNKYK